MRHTSHPTALIILDGFGFSKHSKGNAVANAKMPFWASALNKYPSALLHASGEAVGLPEGYAGNSEVGHRTIGAGCITQTILKKINDSIENKTLASHPILIKNFGLLKSSKKTLHLIGLLSDAGVHSHENHLYAILDIAIKTGIHKIIVHPFLDGRDTPPKSASIFLGKLNRYCATHAEVSIGSIHGRFYAMDRDRNWERTQQSYKALCNSKQNTHASWENVLNRSYENGITDEFISPTQVTNNTTVKEGDGIIFFNFRADRARQLHAAFMKDDFSKFDRSISGHELAFCISSSNYWSAPLVGDTTQILFKHDMPCTSLLDEIVKQTNRNIFVIAESEKFAHVTYFFREANQNKPNPLIKTVLIPSIKAQNYIQHPEMSAREITESIVLSLNKQPACFYLVNYANPDMVGHSGNFDATVKACEILDDQLKILHKEIVENRSGTMFVTADHGNAEEKINLKTGEVQTSHTRNPVPFVAITSKTHNCKDIEPLKIQHPRLGLANIAATVLGHMSLAIQPSMEKEIIFPCLASKYATTPKF